MSTDETELRRAVARLNSRAWGVAGALVLGVGLFAATNILILIGPAPGTEVGGTLGLLGFYLPGYSVSFLGSLIGFVYAFVIGYIVGRAVGTVYNRLVKDFPA
ncbi:MAG: hypothetical protein KJO11_06810 [Gemmatimonadetes bacterium]|nr:hypothetical protein [Gemmatimonadota bacterium]MBT8403499.1 hypothetical protein [Gemmatimonadota bacterium]NNK63625.1 hypothetical protein [Gemmatimonadota bacterium]